ncbi:Transcriptional regulatory protein FixJ [Anatilimnocola aggregata]|uniref:Transcriptional regulatory protein FixJ n=1 Tax=Anatilimnocola aggregata TaxID=2528021 RepID=A0A517YHL6_9BACT|nr:response regulator [Anatilimnocola aggregata]QDU29702.1 Transcriptional regulatory protein FixJ [Anatilimnocola aggregata]
MADTSTIHIIDDDSAVRESLLALVQMRGLTAKAYSSAESFLTALKPSDTGCVVSDVRMPGMSGLQLLEKLAEAKSNLPVIIITAYADVPTAVRAMQAGAVTFLEKPCNEADLIEAIQQALNLEQAQAALRKQKSDVENKLTTLSEDEIAVMRKMLEGLPNKRIASDLDIGLRTVELRRSNIMKKMGAGSLAELVRLALLVDFFKSEEKA